MNEVTPNIVSLSEIIRRIYSGGVGLAIGILLAVIVYSKIKDKSLIFRIMIITLIIGVTVWLSMIIHNEILKPQPIYVP